MNYYDNTNILIIGGSFGIGAELCSELARNGANLAVVARSQKKIEALCKSLGKHHIPLTGDITKTEDLKKIYDVILKEWVQIDIIIFCAGIYQPMNITNFDLTKSKEIIDVNFTSILNFLEVFLPAFKKKKIRQLAILSSVAGYFGMPNSLAYGASKAALSNLTESLFYELRKYGTKVQLVNPGFVKTRLTDKNSFKMPGIISANQAAKIIVTELPKNKFEIKFPFLFTNIMRFLSLITYKIRFLILKNVK